MAAFLPIAAAILGGLGSQDSGKRKSKSRDDIERAALRDQMSIADFLQSALPQTGVVEERIAQLERGGELHPEIAAQLDRFQTRRDQRSVSPIAEALRGGVAPAGGGRQRFEDPVSADSRGRSRRTRRSRLASKAAETKRSDIAEIFGGDLASRANVASAVTGQIQEEAPKPTGINKIFAKANSVLDKIF